MKRIIKQHSPQWFEMWKDMFRVNNGREPHYKGDFSTDSIDGANRRDRSSSNIAQEMIENFGLDTYHLVRSRREAIEASEVFDEEEYSSDEIRSFIEYYSEKDNGKYVPYCKAIVDCLQDMLN